MTFSQPNRSIGVEPAGDRERPRDELARHDRQQRREDGDGRGRDRQRQRGAFHLVRRVAARDQRGARGARARVRLEDGGEARVARRHGPDREQRVERGDRPVREVRGRERLGGDPAGLRQLQRDLAGRRELDAAPDREQAPCEDERPGRLLRRPRRCFDRLGEQPGGPPQRVTRSPTRDRRPMRQATRGRRAGSRTSSLRRPPAPAPRGAAR